MALRQSAVEGLVTGMVSMVVQPDSSFWRGKRVLLTGHSGFKGAWLALWLERLGAHVTGLSLAPITQPNLPDLLGKPFTRDQLCDIRDAAVLRQRVQAAQRVFAGGPPQLRFEQRPVQRQRRRALEKLEISQGLPG